MRGHAGSGRPGRSPLTQLLDPAWWSADRARILVGALLLLGFCLRVAGGFYYTHLRFEPDESEAVAYALATQGQYADAFAPGSGPTAHVGPIVPLTTAAIYKLLGARAALAGLGLVLVGALAVVGSFILFYRAFGKLGISRGPRIAALAFLCLFPFQLQLETAVLPIWEVGYVTVALALFLLWALRLDERGRVGWGALIGMPVVIALLELWSPAVGLAAAGIFMLLLLRRTRWPYWLLGPAITLVAFLLITTPWEIRNEHVLGAPVRTRTSMGLSMAVAYYDAADAPDPRQANVDRFRAIHPHDKSGEGLAALRAAGGEVAYGRLLKRTTEAWIKAHPRRAAMIALRHVQNFYLPPAWFWDRWGKAPIRLSSKVRAAIVQILALAGIATLLWLLARGRSRFLYIAAILALPMLPYILAFPLLRYRFPVSSPLIFLAFAGAGVVVSRITDRHAPKETAEIAV